MALLILPSVFWGVYLFIINFRAFHNSHEKPARIFGLCTFASGLVGAAVVYVICRLRLSGQTPLEDFSAFAAGCLWSLAIFCVLYALCALLSPGQFKLRLVFFLAFWLFLLICTCLFVILAGEGKGGVDLFVLLFGSFCAWFSAICPTAELFFRRTTQKKN